MFCASDAEESTLEQRKESGGNVARTVSISEASRLITYSWMVYLGGDIGSMSLTCVLDDTIWSTVMELA